MDGRIDIKNFEIDPHRIAFSILNGLTFEELNRSGDGYIDRQDLVIILEENGPIHLTPAFFDELLMAIEREDDDWISINYPIQLTSGWFREHFELKSNYYLLQNLDLPIYIFHGMLDQNVDVRRVNDIYARFKDLGKTNLTVHTFPVMIMV